jgi:DNA-binding MarR family transcriptional regulator
MSSPHEPPKEAAERGAKPTFEPRQRLPLLMMQAFHYSRRAFDEAVRPHGLTASQVGALNRIAHEPGISGADLGRRMFTTPQAAQLMLASLERKGLVERKPDPSYGRIVRSVLTEDGRRILDACADDVLDVEQRLCAPLDTGELETLIDLLVRYIQHSTPD